VPDVARADARESREAFTRVGVILTAANTVLERDLWHSGVPGVTWHSSRLPPTAVNAVQGRATAKEAELLAAGTLAAIQALRPLEPQLIVIGLSGTPFRQGVKGHDEWKQELERVAGVPVVTLADALLAEAKALGLKRIALVTPFHPSSSADISSFFAEAGIDTVASVNLDCANTAAIARATATELRNAAREVDGPDVDGILQIGTNLDFVLLAAELSQALRKPVIAANAAIARLVAARIAPTAN
jgi:maleate isomerase